MTCHRKGMLVTVTYDTSSVRLSGLKDLDAPMRAAPGVKHRL